MCRATFVSREMCRIGSFRPWLRYGRTYIDRVKRQDGDCQRRTSTELTGRMIPPMGVVIDDRLLWPSGPVSMATIRQGARMGSVKRAFAALKLVNVPSRSGIIPAQNRFRDSVAPTMREVGPPASAQWQLRSANGSLLGRVQRQRPWGRFALALRQSLFSQVWPNKPGHKTHPGNRENRFFVVAMGKFYAGR
jgi:hypothetical protein